MANVSWLGYRLTGPKCLGSREDGILNGRITGTTAEGILQGLANLGAVRVRIAVEQGMRGHNLPGDAESALDRAMIDESLLKRVQFHLIMNALGKPLNGENSPAMCPLRRVYTGHHGFPVHQHGTCTAFRLFTTDLGARQAQTFAQ
jgi:hypothetical protein